MRYRALSQAALAVYLSKSRRTVGLLRLSPLRRGLAIPDSRGGEQLLMRPDAMHDHRAPAYSIDEQEVGSQMTLGEASPLGTALVEAVRAESRWELLTGNQQVEDVLERFDVEFGMLTSRAIIALEARQND